jgi:hypothetical protein
MTTPQETAAFSREAAAVVNSPYFYPPAAATPAEAVRQADEADRRLALLRDALGRATSYAGLRGEAKAVYDAAKATLGANP